MTKGLRCNWKPYQKTAKAFALAVKICAAINKEKGKYDRNTRCWLMIYWWCSRRNYWESLATDAKLTLNLNIKIWIFIPCAVLKMIKQKPWNHAVSRLLVWQGQKDLNPRHAVLERKARFQLSRVLKYSPPKIPHKNSTFRIWKCCSFLSL